MAAAAIKSYHIISNSVYSLSHVDFDRRQQRPHGGDGAGSKVDLIRRRLDGRRGDDQRWRRAAVKVAVKVVAAVQVAVKVATVVGLG